MIGTLFLLLTAMRQPITITANSIYDSWHHKRIGHNPGKDYDTLCNTAMRIWGYINAMTLSLSLDVSINDYFLAGT